MEKKRILSATLAMIMALSATACGGKTAPTTIETTATTTSASTVVEDVATTTAADTPVEEASVNDTSVETESESTNLSETESDSPVDTDNTSSASVSSSDEAEIRELIQKFSSMNSDMSPQEMAEIVDFAVLFYIGEGRPAENDQEIFDSFNAENEEESDDFVSGLTSISGTEYEIISIKDIGECDDTISGLLTARTKQELADIIYAAFGVEPEEPGEDEDMGIVPFPVIKDALNIEDVKVVTVKSVNPEEPSEEATTADLFVVKREGKWRVEFVYTLENMVIQMFSSLSDITIDGEVDETQTSEENADASEDQPDSLTDAETSVEAVG